MVCLILTVPEGVEDEAMAAIHFAEGFSQRYGHCHPMFFQGSLDDAMREAVMQPARNVSFFFYRQTLSVLEI